MSTDTANPILEEFFRNISKAADANLKLQQEAFRQWTSMWPGMPTPQTAWTEKALDFQKQWSAAILDLTKKHREVLDKQYETAVESLEAALRVTETSNPEEFRRRSEQLCRKTIACMKEMSETQVQEFQQQLAKWTELVASPGK